MNAQKALRQIGKYLLPYGVVTVGKNLRWLRAQGVNVSLRDWWRTEWLRHEAEESGLALFPPGIFRQLRVVVDVGANVGQWSAMLLDCVTPAKLIAIEPNP